MQNLRRLLTLVAVLFVAAVAQPVSAQAAGQTWLPEFSSGQHVYLDPALKNNPSYPVDLKNLESTAVSEGQKNGLEIFVIATQQGSDLDGSKMAVRELDKLSAKWQSRPG